MLASAALGYTYTPADLFRDFPDIDKYRDGYGGFGDGLFKNKEIMEKLNLKLENENGTPYYEGKAWGEGLLMDSLEEGKRAIWCTQNELFTTSGHYIEVELRDGKIWLNDPNGANYKSTNPTLHDILTNGCAPEQLKKYGGRFYIFDVANSEANTPIGEKSNEVLMDEILKKGSPTPTTPTTPTTSTRTITGTRKDFNEVDATATLNELATRHGVNTAAKTEREILLEIASKYGIDTNLAIKNNDAIIEAILPKITGKTEIALWNSLKSNKKESESEWIWPTDLHNVSSHFGKRSTGIEGATTNHKGIDIQGGPANSIYAINGGKVVFVGWNGTGGKTIKIDHGNGYVSEYMHCSSIDVKVGDIVEGGQVIGHPGNTRDESIIPEMSAHLHLAVKYNGENIDPESLLDPNKKAETTMTKPTTPTNPTKQTTPTRTTRITITEEKNKRRREI